VIEAAVFRIEDDDGVYPAEIGCGSDATVFRQQDERR
jgi:hypothetical protein